jgi:outer membrane protein
MGILERTALHTLSLAVFGTALVQPAASADLWQYYGEALTHDATFASQRSTLEASLEKQPQGLSQLLPQIGVNATESYNSTVIVEPPLPTFGLSYPSRAFGVQLTQPLFRWDRYQQYEQSKLQITLAEAQFVQAQQDLIVRVAQAYFDVLQAEDNITFLTAQKEAISEQLASAERNFEVGTATITDTKEAQSRYDLAISQEIAAQSDLEVKQSALEQIIGRPPAGLAHLRQGISLGNPDPARVDAWIGASETGNPGVIQSEASLQIAQRQIEVNRAGHYPTADLVAGRQFSRSPTSIIPPAIGSTATNTIGVQVSIPIFSGGYTSSKVREAVDLRGKAENDLEAAKRSAVQSARQSFVGVTSGLAQIRALEAAERSSESSLESNKVGYRVGVRINIDVLNAQQQLFSTQRDLAKARYDTLMNSLKLKSAAGMLGEHDLQIMNALLEH